MLIREKYKKVGKKALCLIFTFLLSINSFAAVVSDNDGAAFITKAEFEAMKKDFADQITNYNDSIDSKIDGSIASYLAGTRMAKTEKMPSLLDKMSQMEFGNTDIIFTNLETLTVGTNNKSGVAGMWAVYAGGGYNYPNCWWNNAANWGTAYELVRGNNTTTSYSDYENHIYTCEKRLNIGGKYYWYLISPTTEEGYQALYLNCTHFIYQNKNWPPANSDWTLDLSDFAYPQLASYTVTSGSMQANGYRAHFYNSDSYLTYNNMMYNASSYVNSYIINTIDYDKIFNFDDPTIYNQCIQNGPSGSGGKPGASTGQYKNFYFKYKRQQRYTHNQNEWLNYSASVTLNEPVFKYSGIPIVRLDVSGKLKLELSLDKVNTASSGDNKPTKCDIMIMNCTFGNRNISDEPKYGGSVRKGYIYKANDIALTDEITNYSCDIEVDETLFEGIDKQKGVVLFIKCVPDQGGIEVNTKEDYIIYEKDM